MKKYFSITVIIVSVLWFVSCELQNDSDKSEEVSNQKSMVYKMSLQEFAETLETPEERNFFATHQIIDYSSIAQSVMQNASSNNEYTKRRFKVKFRWFQGCERSFGICVIIPIGLDNGNATLYFVNGKCVIVPDSDDNGLTGDGYLPIYCDIPLYDDVKIKEGIYTGYYDTKLQKYAIAVDLTE